MKQSSVPISINDKTLDYVTEVKILGLDISNNLLWNDHISDRIKKASKRLYFLILLKRASVPSNDILNFYGRCVRLVLEYCTPVFRHSLPAYLRMPRHLRVCRGTPHLSSHQKFIMQKPTCISFQSMHA